MKERVHECRCKSYYFKLSGQNLSGIICTTIIVFFLMVPPPSPTHMYAYINRFFSDGNSPKIVLSI